jgi:hypothetical protein
MAKTGKKAIEREMRISAILSKRVTGMSLRQIGQEENPPISLQAVAQLIGRAVNEMVAEPVEEIHRLELLRLDKLLAAVWPSAVGGDHAAVDRCLAISARRARLMGLDLRPAGYMGLDTDEFDQPRVRVEIVNDPEIERTRWLEERVRLLDGGATANEPAARSVN